MKDIAVRCLSLIFASGKYLFYYVTTLYHYEFTNFLSNVHEMAKILVGDKQIDPDSATGGLHLSVPVPIIRCRKKNLHGHIMH
jgi:hypothetical protein